MTHEMTLRDIAASEPFRAELAIALQNPNIRIALNALAEANMPELGINIAPGITAMEAVALDAAKRAGAQEVIRKLKHLPYISANRINPRERLGGSWEYLAEEASEPVIKTPKKTKTTP